MPDPVPKVCDRPFQACDMPGVRHANLTCDRPPISTNDNPRCAPCQPELQRANEDSTAIIGHKNVLAKARFTKRVNMITSEAHTFRSLCLCRAGVPGKVRHYESPCLVLPWLHVSRRASSEDFPRWWQASNRIGEEKDCWPPGLSLPKRYHHDRYGLTFENVLNYPVYHRE